MLRCLFSGPLRVLGIGSGDGALFAFVAILALFSSSSRAQFEPTGEARLWLQPPSGAEAVKPKAAPYRSGPMLDRAVPTNQWYSSLMYERWSDVLHAHPLTFRAAEAGLEVGLPRKRVVSVPGKHDEIQFPHQPALTVGAAGFSPADARLHDAGDWDILIRMAQGADHLDARVLHGGVYAYFSLSRGDARFTLAQGATTQESASGSRGVLVSRVSVDGQTWAVFAPAGSRFVSSKPDQFHLVLPPDARYFSVAALPDESAQTLELFARHAFAFVEGTQVSWRYDEARGRVESRYQFTTRAMDGGEAVPLAALYPHLNAHRVGPAPLPDLGFDSIRGRMPLFASQGFDTVVEWRGILPAWPILGGDEARDRIRSLLSGDVRRAPSMFGKMGQGTYWTGKTLAAIAHLMAVAEQAGEAAAAQELETLLKRRFAQWFLGNGTPRFVHNREIGSVVGYPEEYGSVAAMNDHHFHYGYWIMAAVHLARRDPAWAQPKVAGAMVGRLIADIATSQRGRADFPFLRNFDPYAGHSWAGGDGIYFGHGNNQESSSEAVNAWASLVLWGELTGDRALRDLGVYLYSQEVSAILHYWLDVKGDVLAPEFGKPVASMVFGGKYAYGTWWTEEPRQIQGINLLPLTPASTYLTLPAAYVKRFFGALDASRRDYDDRGQSDGTPADIWQDVFAGFLALSDPKAGLKAWNPRGSVELGETRTRTFHWLSTLDAAGRPDRTVGADTTLFGVFQRDDGRRTYMAYNPDRLQARDVVFSDGMRLRVEPGRLGHAVRSAP